MQRIRHYSVKKMYNYHEKYECPLNKNKKYIGSYDTKKQIYNYNPQDKIKPIKIVSDEADNPLSHN